MNLIIRLLFLRQQAVTSLLSVPSSPFFPGHSLTLSLSATLVNFHPLVSYKPWVLLLYRSVLQNSDCLVLPWFPRFSKGSLPHTPHHTTPHCHGPYVKLAFGKR